MRKGTRVHYNDRKKVQRMKRTKRTITVELSAEELELICNGIDAHVYWDLCYEELDARQSGEVNPEKIEDRAKREEVEKIQALEERLRKLSRREVA